MPPKMKGKVVKSDAPPPEPRRKNPDLKEVKGKGMKQAPAPVALPVAKKAATKPVNKENMKENVKKTVAKAPKKETRKAPPMKKKQTLRVEGSGKKKDAEAKTPEKEKKTRGSVKKKDEEATPSSPEEPSPKEMETRAGSREDRPRRRHSRSRSRSRSRTPVRRRRHRETREEKAERRREKEKRLAERMELINSFGVINIDDDDDEDENLPGCAPNTTTITTSMKARLGSRSVAKNSKKIEYRALRRAGSKAAASSSDSSQKKGSDTESDSEQARLHEHFAAIQDHSRRSDSKDRRRSKRTSGTPTSRSRSRSRTARKHHHRSKKRSSSPSSSTSPRRRKSSRKKRSPRRIKGDYQYLTEQQAENARKLIITKDSSLCIKVGVHDLSQSDFHSLHSRQWVNDSIINAHLDLVYKKARSVMKRSVVYFNSFFWSKLVKFIDDDFSGEFKYDYNEVKNWTTRKNIDIFSNDLLVMPLNRDSIHWSVIAINMNNFTYSYYCSLGLGPPPHIEECINRYLADEYMHKKNEELEDKWKLSPRTKIPLQKNGYDCGVFAVRFAECLMLGKEFDFSHSDMYEWRLLMAHELKTGKLKSPEDFPCNQPGFKNNKRVATTTTTNNES